MFESALMLFTQNYKKISPYLLKLQLAKVDSFFATQSVVVRKSWHV